MHSIAPSLKKNQITELKNPLDIPQRQTSSFTVSPDEYTVDYFLTDAEGKEEYITTLGAKLSPRLKRVWSIAGVKPGMRILDLGCGRGEIVYHCARAGAYVSGIDYSRDAISLAKNILKKTAHDVRSHAEIIYGDMRHLSFKADFFDLIFMLDTVEHLAPNELDEVLNEIIRVLKPGGRCVIHTMPNRLFWDIGYRYYMKWIDALIKLLIKGRPYLRHEGRNAYSLKVHINEHTLSGLRKLLRRHGFKVSAWLEEDFFVADIIRKHSWKQILYESIMRLYPISQLWPLKHVFQHSIYAVAVK